MFDRRFYSFFVLPTFNYKKSIYAYSKKNKKELKVTRGNEKNNFIDEVNCGIVCIGETLIVFEKMMSLISRIQESSFTVDIISEIRIHLHYTGTKYKIHHGKLNSPYKKIKVTFYRDKKENKKVYFWGIYNKTEWQDMLLEYRTDGEVYNTIINKILPPELKNVLEKARQIRNEKNQIRYITERLEKYRKNKTNHNYFPENFVNTIRQKKMLLAKKTATMTSAILKSLG